MSLKKDWWCIRGECEHHQVHNTHKGRLIVNEYCKHPVVVTSKQCTSQLGLVIDNMEMCPVLYDMLYKD